MRRLLKIAGWPVPSADANVHEAIYELYDALSDYWYSGVQPRRVYDWRVFTGRAQRCDLNSRRLTNKISRVEWALELEGPLFGEILNGGFSQFVSNNPFILDETALMLSAFGPHAAFEQFWEIVGPLAVQLQDHRQRLILSGGQIDGTFWTKVDHLFDRYYDSGVDQALDDLWTQSYIGDDDLFSEEARFGASDQSEPWATTVSRNILRYAIENAHDLGVELTFEGYDA
ncbi:MAG: hypothetical protein JNK34_01115 [Tabrizicola sp.]|nr:hypothetical protein [Tabrizicola sp.]